MKKIKLFTIFIILIFLFFIFNPLVNSSSSMSINNSFELSISSGFDSQNWQKIIEDASANFIAETNDGGFVLTGVKDYKLLILKINSLGEIEWEKKYVIDDYDPTLMYDYRGEGVCIKQTEDEGFIILGNTNVYITPMYHSDYIWLIKTNEHGNIEWQKTYNGFGDYFHSTNLEITQNLGYSITGGAYHSHNLTNSVFLLKTDVNGNEEWYRKYWFHNDTGADIDVTGFSIGIAEDNGYIIGADGQIGYGGKRPGLIRTDESGNVIWKKSYSGFELYSIMITDSNDIMVVGGGSNVYLAKIDMSGDTIWTRSFSEQRKAECGVSIQQTKDGGFILLGNTKSYAVDKPDVNQTDIWLVKTDKEGVEEWNYEYQGIGDDYAKHVIETRNSGFMIIGETKQFEDDQNIIIIKEFDPYYIINDWKSGIRLSVEVSNLGPGDAENFDINVQYEPFDSEGRIFFGRERTKIEQSLPSYSTKVINCPFVFGIGPVKVTISVGRTSKAALCTLFGPYVYIVNKNPVFPD
jgi:hypothetical protein